MDPWLRTEMVRLMPRLRARALLLTRSRDEADDLVQETLARAWRYRRAFRPGSNLRSWLLQILRNVHLGASRRPVLVADPDGRHMARLRAEPSQEWRLQLGETLAALTELGEPTRQALLLVAASGYTYEEAAVACGCPAGTLKRRIAHGRERLLRPRGAAASPTAPEAAAR